jgi:hypothetical protein
MTTPSTDDDGWAFLVDAYPHLYEAEPIIQPTPIEAEGQLSMELTEEVG